MLAHGDRQAGSLDRGDQSATPHLRGGDLGLSGPAEEHSVVAAVLSARTERSEACYDLWSIPFSHS